MNKKRFSIIACAAVLCLVFARIIYVNAAYPFAGIRYKNQGERVSYLDNNYKAVSSKLFTKDKWLSYIDEIGVNEESNEHNIMHPGIDKGGDINDYDYYVSYNPNEDYNVLLLELEFDSDIDEDVLEHNFNIVGKVNEEKELYNDYYSKELQSFNESENGFDDGVKKYQVYILKGEVNKLFLQTLEFGNNVMVRLTPERVQ